MQYYGAFYKTELHRRPPPHQRIPGAVDQEEVPAAAARQESAWGVEEDHRPVSGPLRALAMGPRPLVVKG
jgi:hypothetical protein